MSKDEYNEKFTSVEAALRQITKDKFKHKYDCLHESMLTKINMFDEHTLSLEKERKDIKLRLMFLNLFAVTLEEELLILNDFDLLEDEYSYELFVKTGDQNNQVKQVKYIKNSLQIIIVNVNYNLQLTLIFLRKKLEKIQDDIEYNKKTITNETNRLTDIKHTFDMKVKNNKHAKVLMKIFKKKFKMPRVINSDDDADGNEITSAIYLNFYPQIGILFQL